MAAKRIYNLLVAGVGSIGERHVRCFSTTERARIGICDSHVSLLRRIASEYSTCSAHEDFSEALTHDWDAVVIATPAHLHVPMAIQAIQRGCHLFIEKPLSVDRTGLAQLTSAMETTGRTAHVAYVLRSHPALAAMRAAIRSGQFGRPLHLYVTSGQHFPTYRPAYRSIYYRDHAMGGGAIQDALTHVLNAAEWVAGPIDRLVADADHMQLPDVDVEDTVNLLARHGQVLSAFAFNQHQAPNEMSMTLVCERGTARFEYHKRRWGWTTQPDDEWQHEIHDQLERDTLFLYQAEHFLNCLDGTETPRCTVAEAWQTLEVNLAALSSCRNARQWTYLSDHGGTHHDES